MSKKEQINVTALGLKELTLRREVYRERKKKKKEKKWVGGDGGGVGGGGRWERNAKAFHARKE